MFTSKYFKDNRLSLTKRLSGSELIVITAQGLMQRSGDVTFPFRQDSNFLYLTGLMNVPDVVLVIDGNNEFLILPKRSETDTIFGGTIDCDNIAKISGIATILSNNDGWRKVEKLQNNRKTIHVVGSAPPQIVGIDSFYTNPARRRLIHKLKRLFPNTKFNDLRTDIMQMRQVKQSVEIEAIKQAITITKSGFAAATKRVRLSAYEYQIEAEFDHVFKQKNATHGYGPPIIAAGANTCILHYHGGLNRFSAGEFILMDVGAEYKGYSADVTRMRKVDAVSDRHMAVYNAVVAVHRYAIGLLRPGLDWREYILKTEEFMGEELVKLGLIQRPERRHIRKYFSHAIGHSLGLDVHDVCDYKTILENMVITVEPGIYIPEEGIGVRIEDDILITKDCANNLSNEIPLL